MKIEVEVRTSDERIKNLDDNGYIVSYHTIDNIIGKVLTLVETVGLPEKQESSLKDLLKQTIRGGIDEHRNCFIGRETYNLVAKFNDELHKECIKQEPSLKRVGSSPRDGEYKLTFVSK